MSVEPRLGPMFGAMPGARLEAKLGASVGGRLGSIRPLLLVGVVLRSGMCSGELCMAVGEPKREWSEPCGESARSSA